MASIADLLESFRNYRGVEDWKLKKLQDMLGNEDPENIALNEKLMGIGTADLPVSGVGGLAGMIRASHGSPYAFEKFDASKIGKGTGAQSYGYGHYFAQGFDSPVATGYRQIRDSANEYQNNLFLKQYHADNARLRGDKEGEERALAALAELKANPPGHLYNVEMKWPDVAKETADPFGEHHLLSWDEKFYEQPESVKNAVIKALHSDAYKASQVEPIAFNPSEEQSWLSDLFAKEKPEFAPSDYYDLHKNRTGEQIYQSLVERLGGEKEATALLREYGLPGIRYLDEASKTPGKGTSNYVIFDEQIPNIVSRNGVSLSDLLRR